LEIPSGIYCREGQPCAALRPAEDILDSVVVFSVLIVVPDAAISGIPTGVTELFGDQIQFRGDTDNRQESTDLRCEAFPTEEVDNVQDMEAAHLQIHVGHEVEPPAQVRQLWGHRCR
jgi:hypothetical protein